MRGSKYATGLAFFVITALTILVLLGFRQKMLAEGDAYIASGLNTHLQTEKVQENKGRIVDRDNLAWPTRRENAKEMLMVWKEQQDAADALDSMYHLLYGNKYGVGIIKSRVFFLSKGVFNADDGISDLYRKKGNDVHITVSGVLNERLFKALKTSGADNGAAILTNYKTGELLAWTSIPPDSSGSPVLSRYIDRKYLYSDSRIIMPENITEPGVDWSGLILDAEVGDIKIQLYHMNIFISALANNGKACRPNVISRIVSRENGEIIEKTNPKNPVYISDSYTDIEASEALDVITRMEGACHENGAAAELGNIIKKLGYTAAAETGTAGISQINNHLNKRGEKKVTKGTISWIACFLKERPFAMVVALQNAKADSAAVKIACEILPLAIDMSLDEPPFED